LARLATVSQRSFSPRRESTPPHPPRNFSFSVLKLTDGDHDNQRGLNHPNCPTSGAELYLRTRKTPQIRFVLNLRRPMGLYYCITWANLDFLPKNQTKWDEIDSSRTISKVLVYVRVLGKGFSSFLEAAAAGAWGRASGHRPVFCRGPCIWAGVLPGPLHLPSAESIGATPTAPAPHARRGSRTAASKRWSSAGPVEVSAGPSSAASSGEQCQKMKRSPGRPMTQQIPKSPHM